MPTPVTIGQVDFTADEEKAMREGARRARETAAARVQCSAGPTATKSTEDQDGSYSLVSRGPMRTRTVPRDKF